VLVHKAPLGPVEEELCGRLMGGAASDSELVNLRMRASELGRSADPGLEARWKHEAEASTPWMALYYPSSAPLQTFLWAGPLTASNCDALLDSPARQHIAQQLLDGVSAVFVLVESGDTAADQAAADTLARELAAAEATLVLPGRTEDVPNIDETKVRIEFSTIRLSRQDARERIFIEMLLGIEPGLRDTAAPIVFPMYGRGRALYALVGSGINSKTIRAACALLTGPCTCQIKDDNPGVDLLMATDWHAGIAEFLLQNPEPTTLPSPALLQASAPEPVLEPESGRSPIGNVAAALTAGVVAIFGVSLALSLRKDGTES
jgi:hypothetical protein